MSVSQSVSDSVCHTKRVERSTDHNPPPIFTKLATKVHSPGRCGYWLPIVLAEIRKTHVRQTGSGIFTIAAMEKSFNIKYS